MFQYLMGACPAKFSDFHYQNATRPLECPQTSACEATFVNDPSAIGVVAFNVAPSAGQLLQGIACVAISIHLVGLGWAAWRLRCEGSSGWWQVLPFVRTISAFVHVYGGAEFVGIPPKQDVIIHTLQDSVGIVAGVGLAALSLDYIGVLSALTSAGSLVSASYIVGEMRINALLDQAETTGPLHSASFDSRQSEGQKADATKEDILLA